MNNKRSYLDNINAGRRRRPGSDETLDQISRTLDHLESRLEHARNPRPGHLEESELARRFQRLSDSVSGARSRTAPHSEPVGRASSSQASLEQAARALEHTRRQEREVASITGIAGELKSLREDLRDVMQTGISGEFDMLRRELAGIMAAVPNSALSGELVVEFERLSDAIAQLAERSDDRSVKMLRLEMEELKSSISALAREETLRAVDRRWDAFDDRWTAFENRMSAGLRNPDPAFDMLHQRLEEIGSAINSLPDSLSLRSLDERVRTLAAGLDKLVSRKAPANSELYAALDERLDEISRAIAACLPRGQVASVDPQPFERIEARISSLANQVAEVLADRAGDQAVDRLGLQMEELSRRVDDIASRIDLPEQMVERLAGQIADIADRLDNAPQSQAAEMMLRGMDDRFAHLSQMIEQRRDDATEFGRSLVYDLEQRLQEITARLDGQAGGPPDAAGIMASIDERFNALAARLESSLREPPNAAMIGALEARLEDIAGRLQSSSAGASSVDPDVIRNLEIQVKSLSEHLSRPGLEVPELEDIGPRLKSIERSVQENQAAVLEAARQAAAQAIGALGDSPHTAADPHLKEELKALEALARRSDERNTKTFEAIHDTLLKIVDRLGTVENAAKAMPADSGRKIAIESAPSIEPGNEVSTLAEEERADIPPYRSPAQAAAAAARAALDEDGDEPDTRTGKASLLSGLSRKLAGRKDKPATVAQEQVAQELDATDETLEIDVERLHEPLEPGTGTPDLNAIMRRVRDEKKAPARDGNDAAKSDFIAAARRAAQAAAAEAEILKKRQDAISESSGRFGFGRILKRAGKPVAMAVGAGIVVVGGLQLGKAYLSETTVIPSQIAAGEAKSPAPQPARPVEDTVVGAAKPMTDRPVRVLDDETEDARDDVVDTLAAMPQKDGASALQEPAEKFVERLDKADTAAGDAALPATPVAAKASVDDIPMDAGPLPLREAAAAGDPKALFEIGSRYAEGRGTKPDMAKAGKWYEKAAEAGLAPAQYRIGDLYQKGTGVERDPATAKMWLQLAAQQGNASAMHNLGVLHALGAAGPVDNDSAARWFLEAAEHGIKDSQFNLGILSAKGMGVPQDLTEAYKWFALVAMTGDKDAAGKRDEVAATLSPEQLKQAKDKTALWKAKAVEPAANVVDIPDAWRESREITAGIDMKKAVANIQRILNKEGFDAGTPDGLMGERTKTAIKAFQKANGMTASGEVDETLVRALLKRNGDAAAVN
ncbi:peptidoglycan-binding protein [Nitratireductor sp. ZSWI3]|uniref:peptidoglycan-binding protein n=1 Tax=Nitratireductor sp. ZSWI3 TaxID=2966359 RepID=UPI00214FC96B|nr:peptidoglycan-binding protein [Nitratireductor sp. ZSWI3]MCR4267466.1 peptidoglycan-binding protein [Nitratireductor sp. ZSWI3]